MRDDTVKPALRGDRRTTRMTRAGAGLMPRRSATWVRSSDNAALAHLPSA